jgi:hypothetical protein
MVAVRDDVAVIEDAKRADASSGPPGQSPDRTLRQLKMPRGTAYANRVPRPEGTLGGFVGMGRPAFSGLVISRPFKQRVGRLCAHADLARTAPIDQAWESMLLPPAAN